MSDKQDIRKRYTASDPCPVCGSATKGCSVTMDDLQFCRGEPADPTAWKRLGEDEYGFGHYRPAVAGCGARFGPRRTNKWEQLARECAAALTPERAAAMAASLGLPAESVGLAGTVGWFEAGQCFTNAERDGSGVCVGVNRRFAGGKKMAVKGCGRGLVLPTAAVDGDTLFVVEGLSDALAMLAASIPTVGRPNNLGGAGHLLQLLARTPNVKRVVVVGEHDNKDDGSWPGKDGAEKVAAQVAKKFRGEVLVAMPPDGAKDVRAWLTADARDGADWLARGEELEGLLLTSAEVRGDDDPAVGPAGEDTREKVVLGTDEHRVVEQAAKALGNSADLYGRGGVVVSVTEATGDGLDPSVAVRRPSGTPTVTPVLKPTLRGHLCRHTKFVRLKVTRDGDEDEVPAHPPGWCVDGVHAGGAGTLRPLVGVVEYPVVLNDGTVLATNGYDPRSGLLVRLPDDLRVSVPDRPTAADAAAAVDALKDVVGDFPFETDAHRSAFLAGLLTPLAFYMFEGPAPLFLIDANVRAAGKGLLADTAAITLTGRRFPVMSYTNEAEELRKTITTLASQGDRLVMFDNLTGRFGNGVLDAALTADWWINRLLGTNLTYNGPLHVVWWATGNNVQMFGDTARRVCHIRLVSQYENPELREDVKYPDLREHVRKNRGRLLSAALTVLRYWHVLGRPRHGLKAWGSYEGWSGVVREALVTVGLPDPGLTREQIQEESDASAGTMRVVLKHLNAFEKSPGRGVTTGELIDKLRDNAFQSEADAEMRAAVEELCGRLDSRSLGYKFREFKKRRFGDVMLDLAGEDRLKGNRWRAVPATPENYNRRQNTTPPTPPPPPTAGDAGDSGDGPGQVGAKSGPGGDSGKAENPVQPAWADETAFTRLLRAAGMDWLGVVGWLNREVSAGDPYPADARFFEVLTDHRKRAAGWVAERVVNGGSA